jgi:hypothetical protein
MIRETLNDRVVRHRLEFDRYATEDAASLRRRSPRSRRWWVPISRGRSRPGCGAGDDLEVILTLSFGGDRLSRDEVIAAVPCPQCGAALGERCRGGSLHPKRRGRAEALHGWHNPGTHPDVINDRKRRHRARLDQKRRRSRGR